ESLARLQEAIDWRIEHDEQVLANINNEADQRRVVGERIREEIEQEAEPSRTHDLNYDSLSQVRDLQIFESLKQYLDTIVATTESNVFGGVTAGIVFALDKKSVQTHLEDIHQKLIEERQAIQAEEQRATAEESLIKASIVAETNRA